AVVEQALSEGTTVGSVRRVLGRASSNAPPPPHVAPHPPVAHPIGAIRWADAACQAMSGVRRPRSDRSLVPIEPEVVGSFLFPPEPFVELFEEAGGSLSQLGRARRIAPDLIRLGHAQQGVEGISLELA